MRAQEAEPSETDTQAEDYAAGKERTGKVQTKTRIREASSQRSRGLYSPGEAAVGVRHARARPHHSARAGCSLNSPAFQPLARLPFIPGFLSQTSHLEYV